MASSGRAGGGAGPSSGAILTGSNGVEPRAVSIDYRQATKKDIRRVKVLAQRVGRLFYDDAQIIILDQLCTVEIIPAEVLAGRLGRSIKEVGVMMIKLLEDRLVSLHRRTEIRDPSNPHARPVNKSYYYISYPRFIKLIRWRMMSLNKQIQEAGSRGLENKGFICPRCGKTYDSLDVANLYDPFTNELCCDVPGCGTPLKHDENREEARKGQEKGRKFNEQCSSILQLLAALEGVLMPHFDPEQYIVDNLAFEPWRRCNLDAFDLTGVPEATTSSSSATAGPSKSSSTRQGQTDAQIASRPLPNVPSASNGGVSVNLVGSDPAQEAAARRARELEDARQREQNKLPGWHLQSTISGEATSLGLKEQARREREAQGAGSGTTSGKDRDAGAGDDGEDDYYAQYAQLQNDEQTGPQTNGAGDDDDLEFEDVTDDVPPSTSGQTSAKRARDELGSDRTTIAPDEKVKRARIEVIELSDDEADDRGRQKASNKGQDDGQGTAADEDDLDFEEIE